MEIVKNILLLDEDKKTRTMLTELAVEFGTFSLSSINPKQNVLAQIKGVPPDLIFISSEHIAHPDFKLMDIFHLTTQANVPIIYLTPTPLNEDEKELYREFYLAKPLELSAVKDTIKSILNL